MGWTYVHKEKDQSIKEFFTKAFNGEHGKVLDCAVKNRVAYIAFEHRGKHGLEIRSLNDAHAVCSCGGWSLSHAGGLSREEIEGEFGKHVEGEREVFALICLLSFRPRDHFNFGYKDMDECMGPCAADCPGRILDLLTDTDDEYARKWRETCRKHLARERAIKQLGPGAVIELATELSFSDGRRLKRLMLVSKRPLVFADPDHQASRYRIGRGFLKIWSWQPI